MTESPSLVDRVRAFAHMAVEGNHNVRNHLSVSGSTRDVEAWVDQARRVDDGIVQLAIDDLELPITFEERRYRERSGAWVTVAAGQRPERKTMHEEQSEAIFSFASDHSLERSLPAVSEDRPTLEFRYAWFEHRGAKDDVARGGLWKGGRRVAEHIGELKETPPDTEQLAALVRSTEALKEPEREPAM